MLATRVKRAQKLHGQKVIVADLRRHEMAQRADIFFRPGPSTDMVWLSAISRYILDEGLANRNFSINGSMAWRNTARASNPSPWNLPRKYRAFLSRL